MGAPIDFIVAACVDRDVNVMMMMMIIIGMSVMIARVWG